MTYLTPLWGNSEPPRQRQGSHPAPRRADAAHRDAKEYGAATFLTQGRGVWRRPIKRGWASAGVVVVEEELRVFDQERLAVLLIAIGCATSSADHLLGRDAVGLLRIDADEVLPTARDDVSLVAIDLLRRAKLHGRAQRLLHRHDPAAHRHDPAAASGQPVLPATRHASARQVPARPRLGGVRFRIDKRRRIRRLQLQSVWPFGTDSRIQQQTRAPARSRGGDCISLGARSVRKPFRSHRTVLARAS